MEVMVVVMEDMVVGILVLEDMGVMEEDIVVMEWEGCMVWVGMG
jgi:hypothetical protein